MNARQTTTVEIKNNLSVLVNAPYGAKYTLKTSGCQWDKALKAWTLPLQEQAKAQDLAKRLNTFDYEEKVGPNDRVLRGRAEYRGKRYYLLFDGVSRQGKPLVKLCSWNGELVFFAKNPAEVTILKTYKNAKTIGEIEAYKAKRRADEQRAQKREASQAPANPGNEDIPY